MTQVTNNGLTVKLKNGTFFLNDDISVQFEEATIDLNGAESKKLDKQLAVLNLTKEITEFATKAASDFNHQQQNPGQTELPGDKSSTAKSGAKIPVVKQPTKTSGRGRVKSELRAAVEAAFNDFIAQQDDFGGVEAFNHIKEVEGCEQVDIKMIYNIIQTRKEDGVIVAQGKGRYKLPKSIVISPTKPVPQVKEEEPAIMDVEFENTNELHFKYPSGLVICIGDEVMIEDEDAVTEEDILFFPSEYEGVEATVVRANEGSNAITVKLTHNQKEILVYPHWISLVNRGY